MSDFDSENQPGEMLNREQQAAQFDVELEKLLQGRRSKPVTEQQASMLNLAAQLRQEAPPAIRPNPAFRARLAADLRQHAQAQILETQVAAKRRRTPALNFSWRWRLGSGLALATIVAVTAVVAFSDNLFKFGSQSPATPVMQAANVGVTQSTTLALASFTNSNQVTAVLNTPVAPVSAEATAAPIENLAAFGQLPTNNNQPSASDSSSKSAAIGPRIQTINVTTTPVVTNLKSTSQPNVLFSQTSQTSDSAPIATQASSLTYNLKTTLPALASTSQVFRQTQPQITEARLRTLGQHFGLDPINAKFSVQTNGGFNLYALAENDKSIYLGSNGRLVYSEPKVTPDKTSPLSDAEASNVAVSYLTKLGLSLDNPHWGMLQKTVQPVAVGDNSGLRFISFSPARFADGKPQSNFVVSEAITLEVTINANSQITFFDSNLPIQVDDLGKLTFAPLEAATYPLISTEQLKTAISNGQISPTLGTSLRLQQKNIIANRPATVTLDQVELAYAPTYDSTGRLHMMPVILVHGTLATSTTSLISFDGYIIAVQSQYLQS